MPQELANASSPRGAAMGRRDIITESNHPVKFRMEKLHWVDGDYDQGGAYWGFDGCTNVYHAWGDGAEHEQEIFVRNLTRKGAKELVLAKFPNAKFYR